MIKNKMFALVMLCSFMMEAQTPEQIKKIVSQYDTTALSQLKAKFIAKEKNVLDIAKLKGWPLKIQNQDGTFKQLNDVTPDGRPLYVMPFNADASKSSRAIQLNSNGSLGLNLNGYNYTAHVWDEGTASITHQEYDGPGGNDRYSIGDGSFPGSDTHSAHVTGTIMSSGVNPQSKGMAPQSKVIGYDWSSDLSEATTAAANGMILSNHSYGYAGSSAFEFGSYQALSYNWDNLMFNAPYYLEVTAAGNNGTNTTSNIQPLDGNSNYDKLTYLQTSKNNLVVANAYDAVVDASGALLQVVSIYPESSQGPTDDYRIKPDITGNGYAVTSTNAVDNTYLAMTGTSMASPNVTGTLLLLQEHANNVFGSIMKAATLKGLALHTADEAGMTGPDAIYGWGLLNAKKAAQAISQSGYESQIQELTLNQGQSYSFTVNSDGVNPLMVSVSWTDRSGTITSGTVNDHTPVLVNDLDIRVSNASNTYMPYKLTSVTSNTQGDNIVDPYERVDISGASGAYTITVSHKGTLTGGSQNYSLIVTGLACQADITITPSVTSPNFSTRQASNSITASNTIASGASAVYHAGNYISLLPGFNPVTGSTFHAYMAGCDNNFLRGLPASENASFETNGSNHSKNGLNDSLAIDEIVIFPNPNNGSFTINTGNDNVKDVYIYSVLGNLVFQQTGVNQQTFDINITDKAKGVYVIKIVSGTDVFTAKVINN